MIHSRKYIEENIEGRSRDTLYYTRFEYQIILRNLDRKIKIKKIFDK